jgi:hypothetical protein
LETTEKQVTLGDLPLGARLLYRSRKDWREAVVCRILEEKIVLSVCSSSGKTYRLSRDLKIELQMNGAIPLLTDIVEENWQDNFVKADFRW